MRQKRFVDDAAAPIVKGLNVKFTVSTTGIALVVMETNQVYFIAIKQFLVEPL